MQTFLRRDGCALASFLMEIGVGQTLQSLLTISIVIFMVVSLLDLGLRLKLREALEGLRNVRFVMLSVLFGFIICPALAYLLATAIPLAPPYAMGMILLGMTPCSPFLPTMVDRARGDSAYAGAFTLLASVVTVAYMPLAVPVMVTGLTEDAWTIAKPLLFFVLAPTAIGMAIQRNSASLAAGTPALRQENDRHQHDQRARPNNCSLRQRACRCGGELRVRNANSIFLGCDRRNVRSEFQLTPDAEKRVDAWNVHTKCGRCLRAATISSGH